IGLVILILQGALKDTRVVWYGEVPVAPHIVLDWTLGAMICVHAAPRVPLMYAIAFLVYLLLNTLRPFGIRQARVLPRVWGIIADDLAAGTLTHVLVSLLTPFFI
ncbi:MAG: Phosphatidylglycerophosphatase A, partial [candidate division TM6 bacterium GW2011_GWF2_43_17]